MKTVRTVELLDTKEEFKDCRIVVIIGDSCTGKTFVGRKVADCLSQTSKYNYHFVEVSEVVAKLSRELPYNGLELRFDDRLTLSVLEEIKRLRYVVLAGLREKKIYDKLKELCKNVYVVKLLASNGLVRQRAEQRKRNEDFVRKQKRDAQYDYNHIDVDVEIDNVLETDYKKLFWFDDFRKVVGLIT